MKSSVATMSNFFPAPFTLSNAVALLEETQLTKKFGRADDPLRRHRAAGESRAVGNRSKLQHERGILLPESSRRNDLVET